MYSRTHNKIKHTRNNNRNEGRRLQAERERLTAERGHVERDRKHLDDERHETEANIDTQTKEITEEAAAVKLELTGIEGDIANLEKLLLAKKTEAEVLRRKLDAGAAAVDLVRQKFDRQLQRIAEVCTSHI
jgi:chromosome segregation ATPase